MAHENFLTWLVRKMQAIKIFIMQRLYVTLKTEKNIAKQFHKLYYDAAYFSGTWAQTHWLGVCCEKCPLDLWVYQEIIFELKPDLIVETGTLLGGSALFLASICDLLNHGKILSIDIEHKPARPNHARIEYFLGSSTSDAAVEKVKSRINPAAKVMVILDSDHRKHHVLTELSIYSKFVTKGSYLIVEDTNINGHPVDPSFGPGPMEAVIDFLKTNRDFVVDKDKEKFYLTFNPHGYLRKVN